MQVKIHIVVILVLIAGIAGGIAGSYMALRMQPEKPSYAAMEVGELTVRKLKAAEAEFAAEEGASVKIADGSIAAGRSIAAGEMRAKVVRGQSLLAVVNPEEPDPKESRIYAEIAATARAGGVLVLRNRMGVLIPSAGAVDQGKAVCIGQDSEGSPSIYVHDMSKGSNGVEFIYHPRLAEARKQAAQAAGSAP